MALVQLDGVMKRFGGGPPATDRLTFTLESGRILAVLGPSGCGKTTTLRLIAGFEAPDEGPVAIAAGRSHHPRPSITIRRRRSWPSSWARRISFRAS